MRKSCTDVPILCTVHVPSNMPLKAYPRSTSYFLEWYALRTAKISDLKSKKTLPKYSVMYQPTTQYRLLAG